MVHLTLGGIPIILHAGAPSQSYETEAAGEAEVRLSKGALITMTSFRKEVISLDGAGWMGPGFDGLDFREVQELRCTQPKRQSGRTAADRVMTLRATPRPDAEPWGWALVGDHWVEAAVSMVGPVATVAEVAGASLYSVQYMPVYWVKCSPPPEAFDASDNTYKWQIVAREV